MRTRTPGTVTAHTAPPPDLMASLLAQATTSWTNKLIHGDVWHKLSGHIQTLASALRQLNGKFRVCVTNTPGTPPAQHYFQTRLRSDVTGPMPPWVLGHPLSHHFPRDMEILLSPCPQLHPHTGASWEESPVTPRLRHHLFFDRGSTSTSVFKGFCCWKSGKPLLPPAAPLRQPGCLGPQRCFHLTFAGPEQGSTASYIIDLM